MAHQLEPPTVPLVSFVKDYGQCLPLRVRVEEGFCGNDERSIISTGDIYNFHFIRDEKTMSIQDSNGTSFSIPLNSAISFGLIYNPFNEPPPKDIEPHYFESVADIITCKHPPKIIRATKEFNGRDSKTSIKKEEILIVKKICLSAKKKKQHVKVHSLLTGGEKTLYRQCMGHFLTDPGSVRLHLPQIAEFFTESLPLAAKIFLNCDVADVSISHLASDVVTMMHVSVESSIIATNCSSDGQDSTLLEETMVNTDQCLPVVIPAHLNIAVSIIDLQHGNNEELHLMTRQLYERFQSTKIPATSCVSDPRKKLQYKLSSSIREGHEKQGFEVEKPRKAYLKSRKSHKHKEDCVPKPIALEVKPTTLCDKFERLQEDISYSTFCCEHKLKSQKSSTKHEVQIQSSVRCGSQYSYTTEINPKLEDVPQEMDSKIQEITDADPLCGIASAGSKKSPADCSQNYNTPKRLAPQSTVIAESAYISSGSLPQSHAHGSEESSLTDSQSMYDVPRSCIDSMSSELQFMEDLQSVKLQDGNDSLSRKYDQTSPLHVKATNPSDRQHKHNVTKKTSLTELIKNHPLVTIHEYSTHEILSNTKAHFLPSCHRSLLPNLTNKIDEETPILNVSATSTTPRSPAHLDNPSNGIERQIQSQVLPNLQTHDYSSSLTTSYVTKHLVEEKPLSRHKHCDNSSKIPSAGYSDVVNASMTRAQILIARNINELKKLDCNEVQMLLENMNLSQYKQCFLSEAIDGEILAECDEQILLHELNISSEMHRIQIMNIITGKQSVALILSSQGMYRLSLY